MCRCDSGLIECQAHKCKTDCDEPKYIPGQCCPVCDQPLIVTAPPACPGIGKNCSLRCVFGYKKDANWCYMCECATDRHLVVNLDRCSGLKSCTKNCFHGYKLGDDGCPVCECNRCAPFDCEKECIYGYETNEDGCSICRCRAVPAIGAIVTTQSTFMTQCRSSNGQLHHSGEFWNDGCRLCFCMGQGGEYCSLLHCPALECSSALLVDGDCCPRCPNQLSTVSHRYSLCKTDGSHSNQWEYRVEGDTWMLDSCTKYVLKSFVEIP